MQRHAGRVGGAAQTEVRRSEIPLLAQRVNEGGHRRGSPTDDHHKLVAMQPAHLPMSSQHLLNQVHECLRCLADEAIAGGVSSLVVGLFQIIHVEKEESLQVVLLRQQAHFIAEKGAVEAGGERVAASLQFLLHQEGGQCQKRG